MIGKAMVLFWCPELYTLSQDSLSKNELLKLTLTAAKLAIKTDFSSSHNSAAGGEHDMLLYTRLY